MVAIYLPQLGQKTRTFDIPIVLNLNFYDLFSIGLPLHAKTIVLIQEVCIYLLYTP